MARKQAADWPLQLDNQICFAVYSTAHAFNRVYKPLLDRLGLTYPQYLVMLVLWERDDVPLKDIGERLFLDSGTLTPLLKRMETADLIKRTRSTADERQVLIALTPKGQALKEKARAVPEGILASSACSLGELSRIKNDIVALRDRLNAALGATKRALRDVCGSAPRRARITSVRNERRSSSAPQCRRAMPRVFFRDAFRVSW